MTRVETGVMERAMKILQTCSAFEQDVVSATDCHPLYGLFGHVDLTAGVRLCSVQFVLVPRKRTPPPPPVKRLPSPPRRAREPERERERDVRDRDRGRERRERCVLRNTDISLYEFGDRG